MVMRARPATSILAHSAPKSSRSESAGRRQDPQSRLCACDGLCCHRRSAATRPWASSGSIPISSRRGRRICDPAGESDLKGRGLAPDDDAVDHRGHKDSSGLKHVHGAENSPENSGQAEDVPGLASSRSLSSNDSIGGMYDDHDRGRAGYRKRGGSRAAAGSGVRPVRNCWNVAQHIGRLIIRGASCAPGAERKTDGVRLKIVNRKSREARK